MYFWKIRKLVFSLVGGIVQLRGKTGEDFEGFFTFEKKKFHNSSEDSVSVKNYCAGHTHSRWIRYCFGGVCHESSETVI